MFPNSTMFDFHDKPPRHLTRYTVDFCKFLPRMFLAPCLTPNSPARRLESSGIPFVVEYSAKKLCASIVHFVPTFLFDFTILVPDEPCPGRR